MLPIFPFIQTLTFILRMRSILSEGIAIRRVFFVAQLVLLSLMSFGVLFSEKWTCDRAWNKVTESDYN